MGYLDEALAKGTGAAPNRLYAVLVAASGLATLAVGVFWALEPPGSPGFGQELGTMAAITGVLLLSWWAVRKRQGIRRPGPARRGRRHGGGPVG